MATPFKGISSKALASFLPSFIGSKITNFSKIPMFFNVKEEGNDMYLTRVFQYSDFKEAFPHYALLAKSCSKLNYYP